MDRSIISLILFVLAYVLFVVFPGRRSLVAISAAGLLLITRALSFPEAFCSVNWNVMGIFVGTLAVADVFMKSRVPAVIAEIIVDKARNTAWAILLMCALTGFISAFVENVATVLIIAPIALTLARKINLNPIKMMIAIAISSNLQGAATLIGDPPSMLLAGFTKMNFGDFFLYRGKPSIFFAVELGAFVSFFVLMFLFRKERHRVKVMPVEKVHSWIPSVLLVLLIILLAASSFFDTGFTSAAGIICMVIGVISVAWEKISNRGRVSELIKSLDWDTALFLVGIFILVGSLTLTGWTNNIAQSLSNVIGGNIFLGYTLLVFISVIISAFVDNIPFLAVMLPVAGQMAYKLDVSPSLFLFGLLIGASLGGNITPIGASANIVACGLLKKEGYKVRFKDFMKIGIPFTFAAVAASYLFVWFVWKP
ncbi:MAG: TRAP transporter large permease subunit [Candidatus Omnitrophica bacterium]|nr:TRAP transporter large permease subunit [Candidatus Omnitrophota bacterium]